jgi:hypothetical protein
MIGDILTTERGLFDEKIELGDLDLETTEEMLAKYLASVRLPSDAPQQPQQNTESLDFRPFTPKAARAFCRASFGRPRLFNRLGNTVLATAMQQGATTINFDLLRLGLEASELSRREWAALTDKEERLRELLTKRGMLSDEEIRMEDLEQLGFRTFNEVLPLLERLEDNDLATRKELGYTTQFEPLSVDLSVEQPFGEFPDSQETLP